ncbi:MAG TPA: aldo/keto reductase [Anaeromyxobacter sp.]
MERRKLGKQGLEVSAIGLGCEKNLQLVERIREIAGEKGVKPAQLALAWVLHQRKGVAPIPGTTARAHLEENVAAVDISLSKADLARIDAAAPKGAASGDRYPAAAMAHVNR